MEMVNSKKELRVLKLLHSYFMHFLYKRTEVRRKIYYDLIRCSILCMGNENRKYIKSISVFLKLTFVTTFLYVLGQIVSPLTVKDYKVLPPHATVTPYRIDEFSK